jgi:hypothetical protein
MKKYIVIAATMLLASCQDTNENLVQSRGMGVVPLMSEPNPALFIAGAIETSYIAFDVSLSEGDKVDKAEVEVVYNGKSAIVKPVTLPSSVNLTAAEIVDALGVSPSAVQAGDVFYVYVLTTAGGSTTRSPAAVAVSVVCEFDAALTEGIYNFESSDWAVDGQVTLAADPSDPYKITLTDYPEAEGVENNLTGNKITLVINSTSFKVTGAKTILADNLADFGASYASYTNYAYEPVAGMYNSCDGSYTVTFAISVDQGSVGSSVFVFRRPQ